MSESCQRACSTEEAGRNRPQGCFCGWRGGCDRLESEVQEKAARGRVSVYTSRLPRAPHDQRKLPYSPYEPYTWGSTPAAPSPPTAEEGAPHATSKIPLPGEQPAISMPGKMLEVNC